MKGAPDARQIQLQPVGNAGAASLWINEPPPLKTPHQQPPAQPPSLGRGPTICMAPAKLIIHARFQSKCHTLIDGLLNKRACAYVCAFKACSQRHLIFPIHLYGFKEATPPNHPKPPAGWAPSIASSQPITLTDTLVESTPWLLTPPTVIFMFVRGGVEQVVKRSSLQTPTAAAAAAGATARRQSGVHCNLATMG